MCSPILAVKDISVKGHAEITPIQSIIGFPLIAEEHGGTQILIITAEVVDLPCNLRMDRQGRNLRLSVSNTTPAPIPQEQLAHMFDCFYRGGQSRNSQNGGYGIGLSIAKAVVQAHTGKVSASAWGKGASNCGGAADALKELLRLNQQR